MRICKLINFKLIAIEYANEQVCARLAFFYKTTDYTNMPMLDVYTAMNGDVVVFLIGEMLHEGKRQHSECQS